MTKDEIIKKTSDLLTKHGINSPVINVFQITENEGLKLNFVKMPESLSNVAGFFDVDSKSIYINNNDPINRQIFTVAHELGHYILNHEKDKFGVLYRMQKFNGENSVAEQEANLFAANILVPQNMLLEAMKKYNLDKKDDELLASLFGVSKEMMGYRILTLNKLL